MIKWLIMIFFCLTGLYFMMWAFQSASYSVSETPINSEIIKTRAMILFPVSILFIAQGVLFYLVLKEREYRTHKT
ncbi:hypothetical protein Metme_3428 [Methylomonas methanica MC09]|uniref:Uncharacterized protein n=1 Tax=Methylomonas methanica (strain DSM 25384 / MC09) TaxID=857087 RepID=G0A704_METMM|nr:hypothetical protein Metme_3428 [Methylomonas methanica MC09]